MKLPAMREIVEERKGKAIEALSASFAENRLPLEEYERLVEYINKIETERELMVVERLVAEYGDAAATGSGYFPGKADDPEDDYPRTPYAPLGGNLTILSTRTIVGPLRHGAQFVSILGSERVKIRRADLSRQRTTLHVVSILGDSVILVEPGIRVTNAAIPIMGSAWIDRKVDREARAGAPELIVSGAALLGNITIKLLRE